MYNRINDKVVGLLIRARKKELLDFQVNSPQSISSLESRVDSEFEIRPNPVEYRFCF